MATTGGPAWLGIGAQRCGTTWLTRLLIQHPQMGFGTNRRKEQQLLPQVADGTVREGRYLRLFPDDEVVRGEWSPRYLHVMSAPAAAARLVRPDAPVLVMLRDPVERFASGMRLAARRGGGQSRLWQAYAHLSGMYLDNLNVWAQVLRPERFLVLTYEAAVETPAATCAAVWRRLGLEPVGLTDEDQPKNATEEGEWQWPAGMREGLTMLYRPQLERLRDDWGVEVERWASFR